MNAKKNNPSEISKLALRLSIIFSAIVVMIGSIMVFSNKPEEQEQTIIASNFASYDLARALTKDSGIAVKMLVTPGTDLHHYEPSQEDIVAAKNSLLFIYNGGESEAWVNDIIDTNMKTLKLIDTPGLKLLNENEEGEIDEHIWTSPSNYLLMLENTKNKLVELQPENTELFTKNYQEYRDQIQEVSEELYTVANQSQKKVIFADRFPAKYLFDEYKINYDAAFSGCAEDTEVDPSTVARLITEIQDEDIKTIIVLELSDRKLANAIAEQQTVEISEFQSTQNITKQDFEAGKTYIDLMRQNTITLQKALE